MSLPGTDTQTTSSDACVSPNLELLQASLEQLQEQVRFADTKAAFLGTLNLVMLGVLAQELAAVKSLQPGVVVVCSLLLYAACSIISLGFVVLSVIPRINSVEPLSMVFFGDVVCYKGKRDDFVAEIRAMDVASWSRDLANQIFNVSRIAHRKHLLVRRGSIGTVMAMALWIISLAGIIISGKLI